MPSYAVNADLVALRPDITADTADWSVQLAQASADILEKIRAEWWPAAVRDYYRIDAATMSTGRIIAMFNAAHLDTAKLKTATCYWTMARYIYPSQTRDTEDGMDAFTRRAERYAAFFEEEWDRIAKMPIYDFDADATFSEFERVQVPRRGVRITRG